MSDPWIKVYPADMRGDPKLAGVNADLQLALIHAWDLAKNGPGAIAELRASDGRAMSERELRSLSNVSGAATRRMFERWASRDLCVLSEDGGRTLVNFPDLAKRQGIDASAAERKRRERERKRHANVTAMSRLESRQKSRPMSRDVTGENQSKKEIEPSVGSHVTPREAGTNPRALGTNPNAVGTNPRATGENPRAQGTNPRAADPIWDALLEACPVAGEMTKSERGRRNVAAKELREIGADPKDILAVARHLRHKWGDRVAVTPSAITSNWAATIAEIYPNGQQRKLTPEDFDRIAAEREAEVDRQRKAALAGAISSQPNEPEDVPY